MRLELHITAAALTHVTDLGRGGHARRGISTNGASDQHSAKLANLLVGNPADAPLFETTATQFRFQPSAPAMIAVTGADVDVCVDGALQTGRQPLVISAGASVSIESVRRGFRHYVAIRGQIVAKALLGSVAPDPMLGVGGFLTAGQSISVDSEFVGVDHPWSGIPLYRIPHDQQSPAASTVVEVLDGPHLAEFPGAREALSTGRFRVSSKSDHVGVRLIGEPLRRNVGTELISRGVPAGAIEVPPDGGLIALLRGRLVTAGYPIIAVATRWGCDVLGQLSPGASMSFRFVGIEHAKRDLETRRASLLRVRDHVHRAFSSTGVMPGVLDDRRASNGL